MIFAIHHKGETQLVESLWTTSERAHKELARLRTKYGRSDWYVAVWAVNARPKEKSK